MEEIRGIYDCKAPAPNSTAMAVVVLLAAIICSSAASPADNARVRFSWKLKREYGHLYLAQDAAKTSPYDRARSDDMKPAYPLRSHILQSDACRWD